jgi:hypothetical protein
MLNYITSCYYYIYDAISTKFETLYGVNKNQLEQENQHLAETVDELFDYSSIVRIAIYNGVNETIFSWNIAFGTQFFSYSVLCFCKYNISIL